MLIEIMLIEIIIIISHRPPNYNNLILTVIGNTDALKKQMEILLMSLCTTSTVAESACDSWCFHSRAAFFNLFIIVSGFGPFKIS